MINSWKEQKNYFCKLVKEISDHYGGDDKEWLREYCGELINFYKTDLGVLMRSVKSIHRQLSVDGFYCR
jgi:hypothetical protein